MYVFKIVLLSLLLYLFYVGSEMILMESYLTFVEYFFLSLFYEFPAVLAWVILYDLLRRVPLIKETNPYKFIAVPLVLLAWPMLIITGFNYSEVVFLGQIIVMGFFLVFLDQKISAWLRKNW